MSAIASLIATYKRYALVFLQSMICYITDVYPSDKISDIGHADFRASDMFPSLDIKCMPHNHV